MHDSRRFNQSIFTSGLNRAGDFVLAVGNNDDPPIVCTAIAVKKI